jgi:hypothetical protein
MAQKLQPQPQKLLGFAPDLDPSTPGIFQTCSNVIPTLIGFKSAASPVNAGLATLANPVLGSALIARLNGTDRQFAGTASHMYENVSGAWVDQSKTGGYALGTSSTWRFAAFGNESLAVNGVDPLQAALDGAFASVTGAPTGKIIFVANGQVFICNCSAPSVVASGNFWFASGIYDQTQWDYTQSQTLCAYGQLIDTPGPITAGTSLGPNAILFKSSSMYFGTQTGYPIGWDFQAISKNVGAQCQEAVVNTGTTLYFIGTDDFYAYQGNGLPVPIGESVRRWFFNTLNPNYRTVMSSFYDQEQRVIYWGFVSNNSLNGVIDTVITYNWTTQTWGRMDTNMQGFVQILNGQITYTGLGGLWSQWQNLPNISYDSSYWINFRITPGYFDSTNTLQALAGTSTGATITTNAFGDDLFYSTMQQFKMRFYAEPTSGTAIWQGRPTLGSGDPSIITNQPTGPFVSSDARIDVDQNQRWHNLILTFTGDFEMLQWYPLLVQTGKN